MTLSLKTMIWNPLLWLAAIAALFAVDAAVLQYSGEEISRSSQRVWGFAFGLLLAWWVIRDMRARSAPAPYEFGAFVLFAWPLVVPYYLYRTRGRKGLLLGVGIWMLFATPLLATIAVYLFQSE